MLEDTQAPFIVSVPSPDTMKAEQPAPPSGPFRHLVLAEPGNKKARLGIQPGLMCCSRLAVLSAILYELAIRNELIF